MKLRTQGRCSTPRIFAAATNPKRIEHYEPRKRRRRCLVRTFFSLPRRLTAIPRKQSLAKIHAFSTLTLWNMCRADRLRLYTIVEHKDTKRTMTSTSTPSRKSSFLARSMAHRTVSFIENAMEKKLSGSQFLQTHPVHADLVSLTREDMTLGQRLGRGAFSDVYELDCVEHDECDTFEPTTRAQDARDRLAAQPSRLAVKHLREDLLSNRQRFQGATADLVSEAQFLSRLDHPHIITLHGLAKIAAIEEGRHDGFFLVLDRLDCTLADRIQEWKQHEATGKILHLDTKLRYARELASALEYLHDHRLIYRDLKPENIGILNDSIVLFDFGLCRELPEVMDVQDQFEMSGVGTLHYMAPEVVLRQAYNHKADVYSLAMVLYELFFHQKPYELYSLEMLQLLIGYEHERPKIPSYCPLNIRQVLEEAWDAEPMDRPTLGEIRRSLVPRSRFSFFWDRQQSLQSSERTFSTSQDDSSMGSWQV
jgi:serine/threonine protein kinase